MHLKSSRNIILVLLLLGICHSVYLIRPRALLKRSYLRRRLMALPGAPLNATMRLKRQLFREDIPHHRPLTGNTYYLHAGFPHPSRWHDGPQLIGPNLDVVTHHHVEHQRKPGLHDDLHNNQHNHFQQNELHTHEPQVSLVHNQVPQTVTFQTGIVHGGIVDNSLAHPPPNNHGHFNPIPPPADYHHHHHHRPETIHHTGNGPNRKPKVPKPHSEPEPHGEDGDGYGHYGHPGGPPKAISIHDIPNYQPTRKPKTIIHYHPVTVGNIININDEPKSNTYGPPNHVPGVPLSHPEPHKNLLSMAEPFIKTPFKTENGLPDFLEFTKGIQYGPPNHNPGPPIGPPQSYDLSPMLPSYGPPVKDEIPPYGVALPVLAHLHSSHHHHHHHHHPPPGKKFRGGRHHHHHHRPQHRHHVHFHHIHHNSPPPPGALGSPFFDTKPPPYVVHGHVPNKFVSLHSQHFKSHAHSQHHQKEYWAL